MSQRLFRTSMISCPPPARWKSSLPRISPTTGPSHSSRRGPFQNLHLWSEASSLSSNPLNIGSRYGVTNPPGSSRYGSLGTSRSPLSNHYDSSSRNGIRQTVDPSNMSPFVRDVGQILLDESMTARPSASSGLGRTHPRLKMAAAAVAQPTSRQHSINVVQPRRPLVRPSGPVRSGHPLV